MCILQTFVDVCFLNNNAFIKVFERFLINKKTLTEVHTHSKFVTRTAVAEMAAVQS